MRRVLRRVFVMSVTFRQFFAGAPLFCLRRPASFANVKECRTVFIMEVPSEPVRFDSPPSERPLLSCFTHPLKIINGVFLDAATSFVGTD
jgi:hypothetical protein